VNFRNDQPSARSQHSRLNCTVHISSKSW